MREAVATPPEHETGATPAPLPPREVRGGRRALMTALLLAVVMGSLDCSIVNIAFRDLTNDLHSSTTVVVWVALGYLLAATAPLMFMARVADVIGHGRSFRIGATLYAAMTVLCGIAPDISSLIAMRSLQGFGMAMFLPSGFFLGAAVCPREQRGRTLGMLAASNAFGFLLGPTLGSWFLDAYGWRSIFLARLPLSIGVVLLALWVVRPEPLGDRLRSLRQLDLKAPLLLTASFFGILFGVNQLPVAGNYRDPLAWSILIVGLTLFALFLRGQGRSHQPLIDLSRYRQSPGFAKASLACTVMFASFPAYLFVLPIVLLAGLGMRAWDAGLILGSVALITALVGHYAARWSDRPGPELLCTVGSILVFAGYLAMLLIRFEATPFQRMVPMVLIGVGAGLFISPNNSLLMQRVQPHREGTASGLTGTMRQGGYALGLAVMASLMTVVQDRLEYTWEGRAGMATSPTEALRLQQLFERGGAWSADVLTLVLHVGALLAAAMVLVTVVYSIRGVSFRLRNHGLILAASAAFAGLAIPALLERSGIVGTSAAPDVPAAAALPPVAPFGMASRPRIKLPPRPGALGKTGAEVFEGMCAACHGKDGRGLPPPLGFKIDLTTSGFIAETPDRALAEYIREGRRVDDLRNTTGLPMPGMRDEIPDDRIELLVQHLRSIHK